MVGVVSMVITYLIALAAIVLVPLFVVVVNSKDWCKLVLPKAVGKEDRLFASKLAAINDQYQPDISKLETLGSKLKIRLRSQFPEEARRVGFAGPLGYPARCVTM
jgi:hypothetical protein